MVFRFLLASSEEARLQTVTDREKVKGFIVLGSPLKTVAALCPALALLLPSGCLQRELLD